MLPTQQVLVDPGLGGEYAALNQRPIREPLPHARPEAEMLRRHNAKCDWLC